MSKLARNPSQILCPSRSNISLDDDDFGDIIRPIQEIPERYRGIFSNYPCFNYVQSAVMDGLFYTDESLVVSAPTGSGKTAIFELAIIRALIVFENTKYQNKFKMVYISPMKALCDERLLDWHKKFTKLGINCISVTGDSDNIDMQDLCNHNLIITTPEKWDALTRRWRNNIELVHQIKLFMIDEVHLLNEETRGSTLETIVCRMKTIQDSLKHTGGNDILDLNHKIRYIAASATIPNVEDIAEWIGGSPPKNYYKFADNVRPVQLKKIVLGFPLRLDSTPFKFDLSLNYKLGNLIMQYSEGKPTLIFCSTRKITEMTADHVLKHLTLTLTTEQHKNLLAATKDMTDEKAKKSLVHGVGYHHAGLLIQTRRTIEELFRSGNLPILVTTSTLAMGVNLPAHLVIIKSTQCYQKGQYVDYTQTALNQMIGRAGRPQFDTSATVLILTTLKDKIKFEKMLGGADEIESNLHRHLTENLNSEIVLRTITNLDGAMVWLASTYLYIRARKNPKHYGLPSGLNTEQIDKKLLEMCQIVINKLVTAKMLTLNEDMHLTPTVTGNLMAKFYLAFETVKLFTEITGVEILQQILCLVSKCAEFSETILRVTDKKCLNVLNSYKNEDSIRFPLNGKVQTVDMKINCLIQAVLGCLNIFDHSLVVETMRIIRNSERITRGLIEYLGKRHKCYKALLNSITLFKCLKSNLWENSPFVTKQLSGIGTVISSQFVKARKTSFDAISSMNSREVELLINRKSPSGDKILEQINHLPKYYLHLDRDDMNKMKVTIRLENSTKLLERCTIKPNSFMYLLIGDNLNDVLLYEKYEHSYMIDNPEVVRFFDLNDNVKVEKIEAHFISEDWVGFDASANYELIPKPKENVNCNKKTNNPEASMAYMQKFMEMYLQSDKKSNKTNDNNNNEPKPRNPIKKFKYPFNKETGKSSSKQNIKYNSTVNNNINTLATSSEDSERNKNVISQPGNVFILNKLKTTVDTNLKMDGERKSSNQDQEIISDEEEQSKSIEQRAINVTKTIKLPQNLQQHQDMSVNTVQNPETSKQIEENEEENLCEEEWTDSADDNYYDGCFDDIDDEVFEPSRENVPELNNTNCEVNKNCDTLAAISNVVNKFFEQQGLNKDKSFDYQNSIKLNNSVGDPNGNYARTQENIALDYYNNQNKENVDFYGDKNKPSTSGVQRFKATSKKRLTHKESPEVLEDLTNKNSQPSKKAKIDPVETSRRISWRSPLVHSPQVKYSPKYPRKTYNLPSSSNTMSAEKQEKNEKRIDSNSQHVLGSFLTLRKLNPAHPSARFPLTDKECEFEMDPKPPALTIQDIACDELYEMASSALKQSERPQTVVKPKPRSNIVISNSSFFSPSISSGTVRRNNDAISSSSTDILNTSNVSSYNDESCSKTSKFTGVGTFQVPETPPEAKRKMIRPSPEPGRFFESNSFKRDFEGNEKRDIAPTSSAFVEYSANPEIRRPQQVLGHRQGDVNPPGVIKFSGRSEDREQYRPSDREFSERRIVTPDTLPLDQRSYRSSLRSNWGSPDRSLPIKPSVVNPLYVDTNQGSSTGYEYRYDNYYFSPHNADLIQESYRHNSNSSNLSHVSPPKKILSQSELNQRLDSIQKQREELNREEQKLLLCSVNTNKDYHYRDQHQSDDLSLHFDQNYYANNPPRGNYRTYNLDRPSNYQLYNNNDSTANYGYQYIRRVMEMDDPHEIEMRNEEARTDTGNDYNNQTITTTMSVQHPDIGDDSNSNNNNNQNNNLLGEDDPNLYYNEQDFDRSSSNYSPPPYGDNDRGFLMNKYFDSMN